MYLDLILEKLAAFFLQYLLPSTIKAIVALIVGSAVLKIVLAIIKGLFNRDNLYNSRLLFLLNFLIIGVAGYASITANYGTAIRHKMTFMILIFIFISRSFSRYKLKI